MGQGHGFWARCARHRRPPHGPGRNAACARSCAWNRAGPHTFHRQARAIFRRPNRSSLVAQSGVQAALLAERSVTAPLAILDDDYGIGDLFANADVSLLPEPIPADGAIMRSLLKAYPCINTDQSAVHAALRLHKMLQESGRTSAGGRTPHQAPIAR